MSDIVVRTIFNTASVEPNWKTKIASAGVHLAVLGTAFLVTVPVVQELQAPASEHISLIAPVLAHPHTTIPPPHIRHVPKLITPVVLPEKPPPVVIAKVLPSPVVPAPKIPTLAPAPPQPKTQPKIQPVIEADAKPVLPTPKPATKLGSFEDLQAKSAPVPKVSLGGFGDAHGVHPTDTKSEPVLLARVGAFDSPTGIGQSGGGGRADKGSVRQSGFGDASSSSGSASGSGAASAVHTGNFGDAGAVTARASGGTVHSSGFGDTLAAAPQHKSTAAVIPATTPVEILFKPRPSYSAEARGMRLEGQVALEVVFMANGSVKVVRIVRGLGHGLDEAAQQAALQVRFKPATRAGAPVDTNATITITFELT